MTASPIQSRRRSRTARSEHDHSIQLAPKARGDFLSISDLLNRWLEFHHSNNTKAASREAAERAIVLLAAHLPKPGKAAKAFDADDITGFKAARTASGRVSSPTVNKELRYLRAALNFGLQAGLIPYSPHAHKVTMVKTVKKKPTILARGGTGKASRGRRWSRTAYLHRRRPRTRCWASARGDSPPPGAGCGPGATRSARSVQGLHRRKRGRGFERVAWSPKGNKERVVPVGSWLAKRLRDYLRCHPNRHDPDTWLLVNCQHSDQPVGSLDKDVREAFRPLISIAVSRNPAPHAQAHLRDRP